MQIIMKMSRLPKIRFFGPDLTEQLNSLSVYCSPFIVPE